MLAAPMHAHHTQQAEMHVCCLMQPQLSALKVATAAASMTMTSSPLGLVVAASGHHALPPAMVRMHRCARWQQRQQHLQVTPAFMHAATAMAFAAPAQYARLQGRCLSAAALAEPHPCSSNMLGLTCINQTHRSAPALTRQQLQMHVSRMSLKH
jgi:hypothetical protein